jgi:hypothetical protein
VLADVHEPRWRRRPRAPHAPRCAERVSQAKTPSKSKFSRHVATPGAPGAPSPAARERGRVGERRGRPGIDARVDHVGRGQPSTFPRPRRARGSRRSSESCAQCARLRSEAWHV